VRVTRLAALGRLWATIGFFHPYLARRPINWDSALVVAIPRVNAARTAAAYEVAVARMLAVLEDPATRVEKLSTDSSPSEEEPSGSWLPDSVWLIRLRSPAALADFSAASARFTAMAESVGSARGVVFDLRLRSPPEDPTSLPFVLDDSGLLPRLFRDTLEAPSVRARMYAGLPPPPDEVNYAGYYAGWYTVPGPRVFPADSGRQLPVAFVTNPRVQLPQAVLALIATGRAVLVQEGGDGDVSAAETVPVPLTDGLVAHVRLTEVVRADGSAGWNADTVVAPGAPDTIAIGAAVRRLGAARRDRPPQASAGIAGPLHHAYNDTSFPSPELRLLAAFRMWGVVRWFFPYRDIMKEDWNKVLARFIPRLEAAGDSLEYARTVAEMWTHIHDGHGIVQSEVLRSWIGKASPPIEVRMIEGLPTVTSFTHDSAARRTGVAIGDVILAIGGEPVNRRLERLRPITPGGAPHAIEASLAYRLLRGPDGSNVKVQVRGGSGRTRTVTIPRRAAFLPTIYGHRSGPVLRMLPGNIGYADLDRLEGSMVDSMFRMFRNTRAIIFDMRGYPKGTAWTIAPRLTERRNVGAARFERLTPMGPDTTEVTSTTFVQSLPTALGPPYKGRTVMLIDERTQSQAEHTGLFFKAANGTVFVGSPTAGANGDVTKFVIPGRMKLMFSGQAVRHIDGRQLQRVGLAPDVAVRPTLKGIRAGRDEVLERAIRWVEQQSSSQR
jgi:C-terminal processing protease CtpA/Prc